MADDDDLDELLDSALSDFDKPVTPSAKKVQKQCKTTEVKDVQEAKEEQKPTNTTENHNENEPNQDELSQIFAASFAEAASDLEEAMKKMGTAEDIEFMAHLNHLADSAKQAATKENPEAMNAFEENLAKTMNDMAQNAKGLQEEPPPFGDDFLKAMSSMGLDGGDGFDMMPLMQGMMKNLLAKDILYPSLKELYDKYPKWLEENKANNSAEDHDRFTKQYKLVGQICQEYDNEKPEDTEEIKKKRFEVIMELMQKMQECGQPPEELVGKMANETPFGQDGMPGMPGMPPMPEIPAELQNECKVS